MTKRAVLAGCGAMAKSWLNALTKTPSLSERVAVVGLVDLDLSAAERLRDAFSLDAEIATDLGGAIARLKPDMVFDIVVPSARRSVVLAGLAAGCHVLSEKPMAASLADAREMIAAARAAGRIHAITQNRRFIDGVRRIRHFLAQGELGELTALHADFFIGAHFGGFRDEMQHVLLLDMAIHTLDAARFMSGRTPLAVYAHEHNPRGSWYAHGPAAEAIFELSDDVTFTYRGSWAAEGADTSWESAWRFIGTRGTLLWDGAESFVARRVSGDSGFSRPLEPVDVPPAPSADETQGHASVITSFLDAIDRGQQPETAGEDNIKSLAMVFGAIESARTRQRVEIEAL